MTGRTTRRRFLQTTASAAAGFWVANHGLRAESSSPNEKLNVAVIGPGGRGRGNLSGVSSQNVVALCEVDEVRGGPSLEKYPQAQKFHDFRRMLDKLDKQIDAVVVSTPDHTHAVAAVRAMKMGKPVYCEKPLARSLYEVRVMTETAAKMKLATQMGNQGHSGSGYRRMVELVRSGAIGTVIEAHAWSHKNFSASKRPTETPPVPKTLKWNLWLGPAPKRPYHPAYLPFNWRAWWDFGTGGLGDMACHIIDPIFWALELDAPMRVEAEGEPAVNPEGFAEQLTVRYSFPARGDRPAVLLYWHHGSRRPNVKLPAGLSLPNQGQLLVGDKGMMLGKHSSGLVALLPEEKFRDFEGPDPFLRVSPGHHQEWIEACKTGGPTGSRFAYAGPLTETVLLGNLAHRVGKELEWDSKQLKATNCPEADDIIRREARKGWEM